jgi:hypothetical protein
MLTGFADNESGAAGLTYSIKSDSNPGLFDSVAIDAMTHALVVNAAANASGRANITISARDPGGLSTDSTVTVDVNRTNLPPEIIPNVPQQLPGNSWIISAIVTDPDDDMTGRIVTITGSVFTTRAVVQPDHTISFAVALVDDGAWGFEYLTTSDPHGLMSDVSTIFIGLT